MTGLFPEDSEARKEYPVYSGFLQYFPAAIAAISHHSYKGNQKHNPGQPLHHDRAKSGDEPDALMRHLMEADYIGMAWRAMSQLQKYLESQGAAIAPAARNATPHETQHHAISAPMPPAIEELIARSESDDPQVGSLKAGEALDHTP